MILCGKSSCLKAALEAALIWGLLRAATNNIHLAHALAVAHALVTRMCQALMPLPLQAQAEKGVGKPDQEISCPSVDSMATASASCDRSCLQASDEVQQLTEVRDSEARCLPAIA